MNYYKVRVIAGHNKTVHAKSYLTFYIRADNIIKATDTARWMPGVKHNKKDVIVSARQITYDEYTAGRRISAYDRRES